MKKLFVAVLAIAGLVACNNESEDRVISTSQKSVTISIENLIADTRHVTAPSNDTDGDLVCATNQTLNVVFVDASENRVVTKSFASATAVQNEAGKFNYTFHALPESVKGFFVIGSRAAALDAASVEAAEEMWMANQEAAEWDNIVVYGLCEDWTANGTCTFDGHEYACYKGSVKVAPYKARLEISAISCSDLGAKNRDTDPVSLGYETVNVTEIGFTGLTAQTLNETMTAADPAVKVINSPAGQVWSWNIDPASANDHLVYLKATVDAKPFYEVSNANRSIQANKYTKGDAVVPEFEAGNIYKMTIPFSESDLDDNSSLICVDVTVEIATWVVHHITPEF